MYNFQRIGRIPALGADGGVGSSSLMLWEGFSPFLGYKTGIINELQRFFILGYFQLRL